MTEWEVPVNRGLEVAAWADSSEEFSGNFFWTQILDKTFVETSPQPSIGCKVGADTYPYPKTQPEVLSPPSTAIVMTDSPGGMLPNKAGDEAYKTFVERIATGMTFRLYFMWKSSLPDAIPVSLGYLKWGWEASARATSRPTVDRNGEWELSPASKGWVGEFNPDWQLPTWTRSVYSRESVPCQR